MYKTCVLLGLIGTLLCKAFEITDYSKVYTGIVQAIETPHSVEELQNLVKNKTNIAIAGGKYSMGGQTWSPNGITIDMDNMNAITDLNLSTKTITVQAGIRWKDIQTFLQPCNLTVKVMQSYKNFSVGGSLSVNVHGRDPYGSLITTVLSLRVILADGSIVHTSRTERPELFSAVIGGYGACGIILDATLQLDDNYKIKQVISTVSVDDFSQFYESSIAHNPDLAFFNGNLYPPYFDTVVNFCWYKTEEPLTINDFAQNYKPNFVKKVVGKNLEFSALHIPSVQKLRRISDTKLAHTETVVWRSYEMSYAIESLAPHWSYASKILQEYFVPVEHFDEFMRDMKNIIQEYGINMLNISIRYVHKNTESLLSYAPQDCFAFVCYIVLVRHPIAIKYAHCWTQKLIDAALKYDGTYYLPYHLFARPDQLMQAYPHYPEFLSIKNHYDPQGKFQNNLLTEFECAYHMNSH